MMTTNDDDGKVANDAVTVWLVPDDVCNSHKIFLRRCLLVSNSIVKLLADRRL